MYRYRKVVTNNTIDLNTPSTDKGLEKLLSNALDNGAGHTMIIGKTGTGKSNMLSHILNYLQDRAGNIIVLDPHSQVSDYVILANRSKELFFLSGHDYISTENRYSGINVLETSGSLQDSVTISEWIRDTISSEDIISHGTWGPRLEVILGPLLMECIRLIPGITLKEFQSILLDRRLLSKMLDRSKNDDLKAFIGTQMKDTRSWMDMISSTINKLLPILENEELMRIVSHDNNDKLRIDDSIALDNSLIVVDASASGIGSSGYRIASVLVLSKIWNSLVRRGPTDKRTYIVIDEAHFFSEKLIETLLSEGRKYGIVLILSYQFITQLSKRGVAALLGNVKNIIVFSCSNEDAILLSRNMVEGKRITRLADIMMSQTRYSAMFFSSSGGNLVGPETIFPPEVNNDSNSSLLYEKKAQSILKFGSVIPSAQEKIKPIPTDHEMIVSILKETLTKKGYSCITGEARGAVVPDLIAEIGLRRIYFEVEVSDMDNTFRIAKKLMDYGKEQLVLVARAGDVERLLKLLGRIYTMTNHSIYYENGGRRILINDVIKSIFHIYIMCVSDEELYIHNGLSMVKFTQNQLDLEPFFIRRIKKLSFPDLRIAIIRNMLEGNKSDLSRMLTHGIKGFEPDMIRKFMEGLHSGGVSEISISSVLGL